VDPEPGQQSKIKIALEKLGAMLDKAAPHWKGIGATTNPVVSEARVGQQIGPIRYDPSGAAGQMGQPQAQPQHGVSRQSSELMGHLDPQGAATFSAVQGVSQFLQEWRQRKDQKSQAEASNIAGALMSAIENKDEAMMNAILTNPKATKVLDKVYKGWLQKAETSQKAPDSDVKGFEQGLQKTVQEKQGSQQGGTQTPQGPQHPGGYMIPQAGPAQQLGAAKLSAESQAAQQDPARLLSSQMSSQQMGQAERIANALEVSPKELAILESHHQQAIIQGYYKLLTAAANQDAITARSREAQTGRMDVAKEATARAKAVADIQGRYRKSVASIIHDASKKRSSGDDTMFKILKEQIDSGTKLRNNAQSMYEKMIGKDADAANALKQQAADLDSQINHWNDQLDTMKNRQIMQDMFQHLLTPDGEEGETKEEPPPN